MVRAAGNTGSEYFVIMEGKYSIAYMHLDKISVKKGDTVERGEVFGEAFNFKDMPEASELIMQIQLDGKYIHKTGVFGM